MTGQVRLSRAEGLRICAFEAWHEFRAGLRGPMVPLMFAGLVAYVLLMLANSDMLREMGAADVPHNSSLIVYQIISGQAFWLIFVWAWVYAQTVARDRSARLTEVILTCPVSARGLFVARYLGATGIALILGSSSAFALLLAEAMGRAGLFPMGVIGPTPLASLGHAWLLFVLPTALGLGALYMSAAFWTRSTTGPFAASAVVILLWMLAMVMLRGADAYPALATWMDVSGFGEAEHQSKLWTPAEKRSALMELTPALVQSRLAWTLIPFGLLGLVLITFRRDSLVLERSEGGRSTRPSAPTPGSVDETFAAPQQPSWVRVCLYDAWWQLRVQVLSWPFVCTMGLWFALNTAAPYAHITAHAEGPLVPRGHLLAPFLVDLSYVLSVFGIAGFVGGLVRRDRQSGMGEIVDATRAPLGVRVVASALASVVVVLVFATVPALSALVVMALQLPEGFDAGLPWLVSFLMTTPGLLELGAIVFAIHCLVRSSGTAHALSMFAALVAIVNLEVGLVTYPPGQFGMTAHVPLSEIQGYAPWLRYVLTLDSFKGAIATFLVAVAWLALPRGTALTWKDRLGQARSRVVGGAGTLAGAALCACLGLGWVLHQGLVVHGEYQSQSQQDVEDAAWERAFWLQPAPFSLQGGEAQVRVDVSNRAVRSTLRLQGVQAKAGLLTGSLPSGLQKLYASVNGRPAEVRVKHDQFVLQLESCVSATCEVLLDLRLVEEGFPRDDVPPWLHASGTWARAQDVLPRLGLDPDRRLRSPVRRRGQGLAPVAGGLETEALVSATGILPSGNFRWEVLLERAGRHTSLSGSAEGQPLDFAFAWLPSDAPVSQLKHKGITAWHGETSAGVAREILEDIAAAKECVQSRTGLPLDVRSVVQAPRGRGEPALHGSLLWLPEDRGWDVGSEGVGRSKRRAAIGEALASAVLTGAADLRLEPGARFVTSGLAGYFGLECLYQAEGTVPWLQWLARQGDHVAEQFGALDAPVVGVAEDGAAQWVRAYAPLATLSWARSLSQDQLRAQIASVVAEIRRGTPVRVALERTVGQKLASALLGIPHASDVSLVAVEGGVEIRKVRQVWSDGGWRPQARFGSTSSHFDDGRMRVEETGPTRLDRDVQVTIFSAEPSYERSAADNRWPRVAQ